MTTESFATGIRYGLVTCPICSQLERVDRDVDGDRAFECVKCGERLRFRRHASLERALAYLLAGMILYIPANVLPVMHTSSIVGDEDDTIMSGVISLAHSGSWPVAMLVFFASIVIPLLKLIALSDILIAVKRKTIRQAHQRSRLFRLVEFVGRWSMLDVFAMSVLVALVQVQSLATVQVRPAALAFAAVVVLTMLAAQSFDERLLWDNESHG